MHPLTATWWRLLVNRTDGCLRRVGQSWRHTRGELTLPELDAALAGRHELGVDATDDQGRSRWLCLDADDDAGREALRRLALEIDPVTSLFEPSRRGAHLWLLCPATHWTTVRAVGQALIAREGLVCEVFPKSAGRNAVRLPLTKHPKTGAVYPIVDPDTGEIRSTADLAQLAAAPLPQLAEPPPVPPLQRDWTSDQMGFDQLLAEVEQYTGMRRYGPDRAIGCCPFHDDRHPSFSILGGFWRCWAGCGEGGVNAFRARARERGMEVKRYAISATN